MQTLHGPTKITLLDQYRLPTESGGPRQAQQSSRIPINADLSQLAWVSEDAIHQRLRLLSD
jgi:hypothetical protein